MAHRMDESGAAATPGLRVGLTTSTTDVVTAAPMAVRVEVQEATYPLRVSVYLDGDLIDCSTPVANRHEVALPALRGRHVLTARAIDGVGRWGSASTLLDGAAA